MQEKPFHHLFAADSESELEEWFGALKKVIQSNDSVPLERLRDKGLCIFCFCFRACIYCFMCTVIAS